LNYLEKEKGNETVTTEFSSSEDSTSSVQLKRNMYKNPKYRDYDMSMDISVSSDEELPVTPKLPSVVFKENSLPASGTKTERLPSSSHTNNEEKITFSGLCKMESKYRDRNKC